MSNGIFYYFEVLNHIMTIAESLRDTRFTLLCDWYFFFSKQMFRRSDTAVTERIVDLALEETRQHEYTLL